MNGPVPGRRRRIRAAAAVALATVLAGCTSIGLHHTVSRTTASRTTPAPVTTPAPSNHPATTVAPAPVDPLSGGVPSANRVLAVKINDTAGGYPQFGIDAADIVYVEQVEGGLTRLIAVFHTQFPSEIGPVRSVRANDPQILAQYGPIGFAASGGGGDALPTLDASPLISTIHDRGGPGFFYDENRDLPYNTMLNPGALPANFGAHARSIGFVWSSSTSSLFGTPIARTIHTVVGATDVNFDYNPATRTYFRLIDGVIQHAADGATVATPNVIVQFCHGHVNYGDIDVLGNPGHFTETVGRGRVVVFRDGREVDGTWLRPTVTSGTLLRDAQGRPIPLRPGGAWVILVDTAAPLN